MLFGSALPLLLLVVGKAYAGQVSVSRVQLSQSAWQLVAENASLGQVLHALEKKSGMTIHHNWAHEQQVSATCVADNIQNILKCLLGESANLVFGPKRGDVPSEVWVLGSSFAIGLSKECSKPDLAIASDSEPEIHVLRKQIASDDPIERGNALYAFADTNADDVDDVLKQGLNDTSAVVREQALGGWVRRHGPDSSTFELYHAFNDSEVSVRLHVVELTTDSNLLLQAVQDKDVSVRQLASARLEDLEK